MNSHDSSALVSSSSLLVSSGRSASLEALRHVGQGDGEGLEMFLEKLVKDRLELLRCEYKILQTVRL